MTLDQDACEQTGATILKVSGEMDLYSFHPFVEGVMGILNKGSKRILVDASDLAYLDSSGVGGIIRLLQAAKSKGALLAFAGLSGTPHKVLTMCNVMVLLNSYPDLAQARAFLRN